jgi:hypothetical protein
MPLIDALRQFATAIVNRNSEADIESAIVALATALTPSAPPAPPSP